MAITWRGSIVTPLIQAMPPRDGEVPVLAVVNTFRSRCAVPILRIVCQLDSNDAPTGAAANLIMPMMRVRRAAAADVSGGVPILARPPWDTEVNAPDSGVLVLFNPGAYGGPDTQLVVSTSGGPVWQQFTARHASAVDQRLSWDNHCVPEVAASGTDGVLYPGEALVVEQAALIPTGGSCFFNVAWQEDQTDAGYAVAGTVNLAGSPVEGAKVLLVTDASTSLPSPTVEVLTTGAPGTFSKTLASGVKAAVFVQHEDGPTKFTGQGKPFIEKP